MRILNPEERAAAEQRIAEIARELKALPVKPSDEQAQLAAELELELAELNHKMIGIGPPVADGGS